MKKIYSILLGAALMLIGSQAYAQLAVGAGYLNATDKSSVGNHSTSFDRNGFYAGATYGLDLSSITEGLGFEPGAALNFVFGKTEADVTDANHLDIALQIPLNFKYTYELDGDLKVFGLAGPALQLGLIKRDKWTTGGDTTTRDYYSDNGLDLSRFNVLLGLGVGVEFGEKFQIRFGYEFGLLPLYNEHDIKYTRPGQLKFGVAYLLF